MKAEHTFRFVEYEEDRKVWLIKCIATGGEFSSELWALDKITRNKCPCCEEKVNMKNKN